MLAAVTVWLNVVFLSERYYPLRWISPGMALMALMVVYPILFTVGVSFTNYGSGHLVTKQLAIRQIEAQTYLAADSPIYSWVAYQNAAGDYLLWLTDPDTGAAFTVAPGEEPVERSGDPPAQMDGYTQIPMNQIFPHLGPLSALVFGVPPDSLPGAAGHGAGCAVRAEVRLRRRTGCDDRPGDRRSLPQCQRHVHVG